ncbi:MAG TPA: NUMOD4 domain-containing protein [Segetibacter sp.]
MSEKVYPYQNISLENLEGEVWKNVPGLDGYFLISNFGRIKRQEYELQHPNGFVYILPEKIIKPKIGKAANKFKNDYTVYITGKVVVQGRTFAFSVPRIVYYCFVHPFNLKDKNLVVLVKDTDNLNIHSSNLILADLNQKRQRVAERKRFRNTLLDLSEEKRATIRKSILKAVRKQATQFSLEGEKIRIYESASEASRITGVSAKCIGEAASGLHVTAGGFLWRWGNEEKVDVNKLRQDKRIVRAGLKVTQYDLHGKKIAHFASVEDAAKAEKVNVSGIYMVLRGKSKSSKGYFWKKGYGEDSIDL